ncbi:MAG: class I SAM-dependent methyltransferase [Phenylobacterium sp.]|uniref:class I SAM-dependent methyltransferase n=1 Tax=Phenylobacterium sp. TaxID=1871053 RepID=UPI00391D4057
MSLRERLAAQIRLGGPLTVAQYMAACLYDPQDGYYAVRPALGAQGDFVTAPGVSQMFGELIGLWAVECWNRMGRPASVRLVEIGPGDGSLMSDLLRAARLSPAFCEAADVWLVEVSEPLRERQRALLGDRLAWARTLEEVPAGAPILLIANEVLDCLPARQLVRADRGWAERMVGLDPEGELVFGLAPTTAIDRDASPGAVLEISAAQQALGAEIGARVVEEGGAALLIDYGRAVPGFGDTLQAIRAHRKEHPLASPGEADLTVHADFPTVLAAAHAQGAAIPQILTRGGFLFRRGIAPPPEALTAARPDRGDEIGRQLERLVAPDQMGELFKAACIHRPGFVPPAFESPS